MIWAIHESSETVKSVCVCVCVCVCMYLSVQNTQAVTAHILPTLRHRFKSCVILGNAFNLTGNRKKSKVHRATDEDTLPKHVCLAKGIR